ncbi:uncharacterized protein LOC128922983 [Zeugodacus cucurbitae]|uniref:uncharacterized protein LOC128922983 n=1 Tax=Zeugodacus cucurbitae TaxID=28588 RepID=UPI0023D92FF5|nr:uncharacterized protein LOC128922983 [Zeugodacus cucurbitae]
MPRYNLRSQKTHNANPSKMPISNEDSSSDNDGDSAMVMPDNAVADLQKQIRQLQLSLEASEKERLSLKQTLASTTAAVDTKIAESLADSFQVSSDAPVKPMYAYTNTADTSAYSLSHMNFANAAVLAPPNFNVNAADAFFTRSNAYTNSNYNPTSANQHMPCYMQSFTPYFNVTAGNFTPNVNFADIKSTAATSLNNTYTSPSQNNNTHTTCMPPSNQHFIRKLQDLPQFSGSPEEWPMFIVAFKETTNMFAYTNVENLLRLQKALKGDARSKVESLLIHPSSVNAVISSLQFHYGRPELLIRSQLAKIRTFPSITSGKIHEIANFSSMVTNLVAFLENASAAPHLSNPTLLDELVSKLPIYKREEWARHTFAINKPYPTICEFSSWLQQMSTYVVMATELNTPHVSSEQLSRKYNRSPKSVLSISEEKFKCIFCKDNHRLYQCMKFKEANNDKRWNIVKTNRLCFSCLSPGHNVYNCTRRRTCGIASCQKYHNKLLHNQVVQDANIGNSVSAEPAVATVSTCEPFENEELPLRKKIGVENTNKNKTLLKFLPINLHGPKGSINIIAFIDDGARVTLIEEEVANKIGLKGRNSSGLMTKLPVVSQNL